MSKPIAIFICYAVFICCYWGINLQELPCWRGASLWYIFICLIQRKMGLGAKFSPVLSIVKEILIWSLDTEYWLGIPVTFVDQLQTSCAAVASHLSDTCLQFLRYVMLCRGIAKMRSTTNLWAALILQCEGHIIT